MRPAQKSDFDRTYTPAEYLELIEQLDRKYELVNGRLVDYRMMAGTSEWHALIAANMTGELRNRLKGMPCRVFSGDLILRVPKTPNYRFGDLVVICGPIERDPDDTYQNKAILNPKLIVEIISPSTKMMDQTVKFDDYVRIDSLEEYVIVEQNRMWIQTATRQKDGTWLTAFFSDPAGAVIFKSLRVELPLAEIYAGVEFPVPSAEKGSGVSQSGDGVRP